MPNLTFRPERHEYRIDGVVVPSVTQVLSEAGLIDGQWYTEESQLRGRTVHIMTALDDEGGLDESKVADEHRGYLNAWRLFRAEATWVVLDSEEAIYHPVWCFAGRYDRRMCTFEDAPYSLIVEIKTGGAEHWHQLQTAAYERCVMHAIPPTVQRYAIYLADDGTYKLRKHDDPADWDVFLAALALANWKRNKGIKTNDRHRSN